MPDLDTLTATLADVSLLIAEIEEVSTMTATLVDATEVLVATLEAT